MRLVDVVRVEVMDSAMLGTGCRRCITVAAIGVGVEIIEDGNVGNGGGGLDAGLCWYVVFVA